ncbi:MAG: hypothetical protein RL026_1050 [Pseudomonadota bacterium]|jgi:anhydro-N-acetylmuramic acid kinase
MLYVGLMSGTSMDGIDAVLVRIADGRIETLAARHQPYPAVLAAQLQATVEQPAATDVDALCRLDVGVARCFAEAALSLLSGIDLECGAVRAIGSHGQTLRHQPRGATPFTLQIGDPNTIAELTGIDVVADFRRRDVAAGGEGAPLVPGFHAEIFRRPGHTRVVANIGGIANITVLPASAEVSGFDTGPGNCLMDLYCRERLGLPLDDGGRIAAGGKIDRELLQRLLDEPYFHQPPPKSTGRELFNGAWLAGRLAGRQAAASDMLATLCEFTALTLGHAIRDAGAVDVVYVCGGGARNPELLRRLAAHAGGARITTTSEAGLDPQWVEGAAFAWLAHRRIEGLPGNLPAATGAHGLRVLGGLYPGGGGR